MRVGHKTQLHMRSRPSRYDHLDRRVQKVTPEATHTYFYDGWMLIKETVANTNGTTDVIEYHWGKDLSGTIGGAGGVGGLLYLSISNSSTRQLYVPFYDAYGNVMGYWDAQGNVVAQYTYDAFGKLISSSGPMADMFSFRHSTKYFDPETGLYYYGYRFYSPELMRWITRDPIGNFIDESFPNNEPLNLYCFLSNDVIRDYDYLGLTSQKKPKQGWKTFGQAIEFHNWNCWEWKPEYGTTSKYVEHFKDKTFKTTIKVPVRLVSDFANGVINALEMNNDSTSCWCMTLSPLLVQAKKEGSLRKYRIKMYVMNFDKHPQCKGKGKRKEIHQTKFEKKWVFYEL